jgi:hypothetical protein
LTTRFVLTAVTVSGIKGTIDGNGIVDLCLPPYLKTPIENIEVVVKTRNGDWGTANVTASVGGSSVASDASLTNSLVLETSMP